MRLLFLITLIGILGSCSSANFSKRKYTTGKFKQHSNYRVVKAQKSSNEELPTDEIEVNETEYVEKVSSETVSEERNQVTEINEDRSEELFVSNSNENELVFEESISDLDDSKSINYFDTDEFIEFDQPTDTLYISSNEVNLAKRAQKKGTVSLILALAGIPATLLTFVGGIVLWIIAIVFAAKSLRAKYNTREGVRRATFGLIFSIVMLVICIAAIVILFLLLFGLF